MLNNAEVEKLKNVIDAMAELELAMSDLYQSCFLAFNEDRLWQSLSEAEKKHASHLSRIKDLMIGKAKMCELGRPFNIVAVNTFIADTKDIAKKIANGEVTRSKMLILARDYEQSILESRYGDVLKTSDIECQKLIREIIAQTYEHKQVIQKAIDGK